MTEFSQPIPPATLALLSEKDETFHCPGESQPVSRAVHLGRMASGYAACENCAWGRPTDEDVETLTTTAASSRNVIHRTSHGFRGQYINAVDRQRAARLASVIASYLGTKNGTNLSASDRESHSVPNRQPAGTTIAVGYGGHRGAPDIFSGVVSAVLQAGCHVVDAGRCTASSLLHVVRSRSDVSHALMITGAEAATTEIGIDILNSDGRALAIPWQDYGVAVELFERHGQAGTESEIPSHNFSSARLRLPVDDRARISRPGRSSGRLIQLPCEDRYRRWLKKWWPTQDHQRALLLVTDEFDIRRLEWLMQDNSQNLEVRRQSDATDGPAQNRLKFVLAEDDRFLTVYSDHGVPLSTNDLVNWINVANSEVAPHVTAHAADDGRRILLYDVGSPTSGEAQQIISDGLAVTGLLLSLANVAAFPSPSRRPVTA